MALEQVNTIDFIGIEKDTDHVVLTIADSWDWTDEHSHLLALQAKLNSYFEFIESDQVWDPYPAAKGRQLRIEILFRLEPPAKATEFLSKASDVASELDVFVSYRTLSGQSRAEPWWDSHGVQIAGGALSGSVRGNRRALMRTYGAMNRPR